MYTTVAAWEKAGKKPDCYVYDTLSILTSAGIPVVDAMVIEGMWIKIPVDPNGNVPDTKYRRRLRKYASSRTLLRASSIEMEKKEFVTNIPVDKEEVLDENGNPIKRKLK